MKLSVAQSVQFLLIALILGSYGQALIDRSRAPFETLAEGRAPGRRWAALALLCVALMAACELLAHGPRAAWVWIGGGGLIPLAQAALLVILVEAGGLWGRCLGADPFRLSRRALAAWPWKTLTLYLLLMLAWTGALAWLWPHRLARHPLAPIDLKTMPPVLGALALAGLTSLAPILEECLFRHYLLYRLAWSLRRGPRPVARAAVLSSLAWALAHYGLVEPFGLKFTQIFGLGLLLSTIARRHGLGAAIALHWVFNMSLIPLALIL